MKKLFYPLAIAITLGLSAFTGIQSSQWKLSDKYAIEFKSDNPTGVFKKMSGTIQFDEKNLERSQFDMTVDVASIEAGNGIKTKHAKSEKWFDAKKYPNITFKSNKINKSGAGFKVEGTLNMHGVQREISFPFTFESNTFKANFEINRLDYKIGNTEGMNANASTMLKVRLNVPVTK